MSRAARRPVCPLSVFLLCTAAVVATAADVVVAAAAEPRVTMGTASWWSRLPPGWLRIGRADPTTGMELTIGVRQRNWDRLDELLLDVSHPASPNYGRHYDDARIVATFCDAVSASPRSH